MGQIRSSISSPIPENPKKTSKLDKSRPKSVKKTKLSNPDSEEDLEPIKSSGSESSTEPSDSSDEDSDSSTSTKKKLKSKSKFKRRGKKTRDSYTKRHLKEKRKRERADEATEVQRRRIFKTYQCNKEGCDNYNSCCYILPSTKSYHLVIV